MDVSVDRGLQKLIDTAGAGASFTSPGWLTQLGRLWGGKSVRMHAAPLVWPRAATGMHAMTDLTIMHVRNCDPAICNCMHACMHAPRICADCEQHAPMR